MQRYCSSCGRQQDPGHRFCPDCGAAGDAASSEDTTLDRRPLGRRELDGPALTAVVVGVLIGLVVSSAVVWFFLVDDGSDTVAAVDIEAIDGTEEGAPQTLSIGTESEAAVDSDRGAGPSLATSTTATSTTASTTVASTSVKGLSDTTIGTAAAVTTQDSSCPENAGVDNRSDSSQATVLERWSDGLTTVMLCRSEQGSLTYFGRSDRGSIYLDAQLTAEGFTARNRDTSYDMSNGVLSINYPGETVRLELQRAG